MPQIDGLRAVAALGVVVGHIWGGAGAPTFTSPLAPVILSGSIGVDMFFVISGFLLFLPYASNRATSVRLYARRRAARILPAFYVSIGLALSLWHWTTPHAPFPLADRMGWFDLAVHASLLQWLVLPTMHRLVGFGPYGHWWSLTVELCFYAALPVVARRYLRRPLAWCSGIVIFSLAFRVFTFSDLAPRLGERPLRVLAVVAENLVGFGGHFAVGMIAAVLLVRGPTATIRRHSRLILAAGVVTCIGGAWVTGRNNMDASLGIAVDPMVPAVTRPIFAIGFAAVVLVIASQNLLRSGLGGGPMKWIGDRSYGLYLLHPAVIYLLEAQTALLAPRPPSTFVFVRGVVIAVPLSIAVGALTFRYIEVPAVRWARHSERDRESTRE